MVIKALKTFSDGVIAMHEGEIANVPDTKAQRFIAEGYAVEYTGEGGEIDLSAYAKKTDLENYAKSEDVENLNTDDISIKGATVVYDINHLAPKNTNLQTIDNGIYTFVAPAQGNTWAEYIINDSDLTKTDGIAKLIINVTEVNGNFRLYLTYKQKSDGNTKYTVPISVIPLGKSVYDIDLSHLSVYDDYDGSGIHLIVANESISTDAETYSIKINQYDVIAESPIGELQGDTLTDVLANINNKVDSIQTNTAHNELIAPNGEKYITQIKNDGTLSIVPKLPSNILYIGNSLLVGFGTHGMASTTVNDDYYAKVNAYLESKGKTLVTDKISGTTFEGATSDSAVNSWLTNSLSAKMSNDRQLVIIQLADNVNTTEKQAEFNKSASMLAEYVRTNCPNARVAWVSKWYVDSGINNIIRKTCEDYGLTYINISDIRSIEGNQSYIGATYIDANGDEQTVSESGVASHPSDAGFTAIANRIISTLFE